MYESSFESYVRFDQFDKFTHKIGFEMQNSNNVTVYNVYHETITSVLVSF